MDSIFCLGEGDRSVYLQQMMQSFDCDYICLWSYLPQPSRCLLALDGLYRERSNQAEASSSAGSLAKQLFHVYRESVNYINHIHTGRIPGMAFKNNLPYMELKLHDLQRLASNQVQLQFYQEAGIKTAVFMGCTSGEIELGMSKNPQVDLETEMKILFPVDFSRDPIIDPTQQPSSSSSSLRSLSGESPPEYSPLLFHINPTTTTTTTTTPTFMQDQTLKITTTTNQKPLNIQFPTIENEDDAMIKAILTVLSNPSSSQQQNLPDPNTSLHDNNNPKTAFKRYIGGAAASIPTNPTTKKHNMFKRGVVFFRNLMNIKRRQELQINLNQTGNRPNATQLHHMISERRRREKLNESFQILRSLLPPGSKKDKASVLSYTTEYLSCLKSQVEELSKRNQILESQIQSRLELATSGDKIIVSSNIPSSVERTNVEITQVSSSSTSEARFLDVRVSVRGEFSMLGLIIRIMELLKQQRNVSLLSVESNTGMVESIPVHGIIFRLRIEGQEFDESGLREAVGRVVDDR